MWLLILLAAVLGVLVIRKRLQLAEQKIISIPLAPLRSKVPIAGYVIDLMTLGSSPWQVIDSWIRSTGSVLRFHFFGNHFVVVADPDLIKHIFQNKFQNYQKDILISYSSFMPLLGSGLVTSHGEHWLHQRKLLGAVFKIEILQDTVKVAVDAANRLSNKIDGLIAQGKGSTEIEMSEEFRRLTLQVIGDAVLGLTPEESDNVFPSLYLPIVDLANENVWYPWKAYVPSAQLSMARHALKDLNQFFTSTIKTRIQAYDPDVVDTKQTKDILGKIIRGMDENGTLHEPGVVPQVCDEIKTFIFAGHETSSMMLTWALYELFKNPECMQKVLDEANNVFSPSLNGELPSFEKLQELSYTQNCLKEALRKYFIVPVVTRVAMEDDTLGDYHIPKGTRIVIPILSIHHREDLWDQPEKFMPERFDNPNMHPYIFLGFIAGARRCLGQHFALLETKIVLALLVQRFHFAGTPDGKTHPYKIPICPNNGMVMELSKRTEKL